MGATLCMFLVLFCLKGYAFAGVHKGVECHCGDSFGRKNANIQCDGSENFFPCPADPTTVCGAITATIILFTGKGKITLLIEPQQCSSKSLKFQVPLRRFVPISMLFYTLVHKNVPVYFRLYM